MKAAIIVFPGTNCDQDTHLALEHLGYESQFVWHDTKDLSKFELIVLPGGFSHGDYVRAGRLAKFSPATKAIKHFIQEKKGFVLGVCNGFQLLCEMGLLPGALINNKSLKFICKDVEIKFQNKDLIIPVAHKEGCYYIPNEQKELLNNPKYELIKYKQDINGSYNNIAGIYDKEKNILGLMPHPERAVLPNTELNDGKVIFKYIESKVLCRI